MSCKMCGECCTQFAVDISYSDVLRWNHEGRRDILNQVSWNKVSKHLPPTLYFYRTLYKIHGKSVCPFLKDNKCSIHSTKPLVCRITPYVDSKFKFCPNFSNITKKDEELINHSNDYSFSDKERDIVNKILEGSN